MSVERRNAPRQRSFLRGCVYFNNRRSAVDCMVRDLSETGARLTFADATTIPDTVELSIPQKQQTLRASVQWRKADEVGIAFVAADAHSNDGDLAERVQKLEAEIAALKRMIRKMKPAGADTEAA